jgi:acetyl-CoA carboxylase / biotin carboxylase 1
MAANGVVHQTVSNDFEGIFQVLKWLSYVPPLKHAPLPYLAGQVDAVDREIEYSPSTCDPRIAICGERSSGGKWIGGIFDQDSFTEALQGWAPTVVIGRARLGGIPIGVIAVESKPVQQIILADPGHPDSHEQVQIQVNTFPHFPFLLVYLAFFI